MRPIISIVGKSHSGKTTLLEGLITELKKRGYKIAVIKHAGENFELDKEGKDSWRFSQAGGELVAISSPHKFAVIKQVAHDLSPQELSRLIDWDYDLILTEGFRQSSTLKIEVYQAEEGEELLCSPKQLLAVVTDKPLDIDVPRFPRNEIKGLADLVENWLIKQRRKDDIDLTINGNFIPMNPFVKSFITRTLLAMVSGLKGVKKIRNLHISLRRKA